MHSNEELIRKFYESFQARDATGMNVCYDSQIVFNDPVFGQLEGAQAFAMWQMLCKRAKDLEVIVSNIHADDKTGSAHWEAKYTFGRSGRRVHNVIEASFIFRNGKIIEHTDTFDVWRWSRMAVGTPGLLLGWLPSFRFAIQKSTRRQLEEYMQKQPAS